MNIRRIFGGLSVEAATWIAIAIIAVGSIWPVVLVEPLGFSRSTASQVMKVSVIVSTALGFWIFITNVAPGLHWLRLVGVCILGFLGGAVALVGFYGALLYFFRH